MVKHRSGNRDRIPAESERLLVVLSDQLSDRFRILPVVRHEQLDIRIVLRRHCCQRRRQIVEAPIKRQSDCYEIRHVIFYYRE